MDDDFEHQKDSAELANEQGFTGTLPGFLDWLEEALCYGGVRVHDAEADRWGRLKTKVELVTGGYSSDEHLLHRVSTNVYVAAAWRSTHAGGLYVYEFDQSWMTSRYELVWLAPDTGLFNSSYRARVLRIEQVDGGVAEFAFPGGVEMLFTEPDRVILEPAGVLTVRAAPEFDLLPSRAIASEKAHVDEVPPIGEIAEAFGIELEPSEKPTPKPRPPMRVEIPAEHRTRQREGRWAFSRLAREQVDGLEQTTADVAALLEAPHVSITAPSGTAVNHYADELLILVSMDDDTVISVVESDEDRPRRRGPSPLLWVPIVKAPSGGSGRKMPSTEKEIVSMLREHGFETERRGSGHLVATHEKHPGVRMTVPSTPSDFRSFKNTLASLKRLTGIDITAG